MRPVLAASCSTGLCSASHQAQPGCCLKFWVSGFSIFHPSSSPFHGKKRQGWVERDGYGLPGACCPGSALQRACGWCQGHAEAGLQVLGQGTVLLGTSRWLCSPRRGKKPRRSARQQHHWSGLKGQTKELRTDTHLCLLAAQPRASGAAQSGQEQGYGSECKPCLQELQDALSVGKRLRDHFSILHSFLYKFWRQGYKYMKRSTDPSS